MDLEVLKRNHVVRHCDANVSDDIILNEEDWNEGSFDIPRDVPIAVIYGGVVYLTKFVSKPYWLDVDELNEKSYKLWLEIFNFCQNPWKVVLDEGNNY